MIYTYWVMLFKSGEGEEICNYTFFFFFLQNYHYQCFFSMCIKITNWYLLLLAWRTSFSILHIKGLLSTNMFNFCLPGNIFILPSFFNDSFTKYKILGWHFNFQHFSPTFWLLCFWCSSCLSYCGSLVCTKPFFFLALIFSLVLLSTSVVMCLGGSSVEW